MRIIAKLRTEEWIYGGAVLIATALVGALFFRGFWSARVFLAAHDTFGHDYLMWEWGWKAVLSTREIPLWNPWLFGGWPFVASFAFCPYYPPAWLSVPQPTSLAITTQYALHLVLGALGFYVFLRAQGIRPPVALGMALFYEAGGHVVSLAFPGHLAKVQAIAWLPWAMAGTAFLARRAHLRWAMLVAVSLALQMLASHAQVLYATGWLVLLYGFCAFLRRSIGLPQGALGYFGCRMGLLLIAVALAAMLSAVQALPSLEMAMQSNRGGGLGIGEANSSALPANELLEVVLPSFRGDSTGTLKMGEQVAPYLGRWNARDGRGERLVTDYAGVWPAAFALVGILFSRRKAKWFFLAALLGALTISIGPATPIFGWLFRFVPGFDLYRSPGTFMVIAHFGLFALAAFGLEHALERALGADKRRLALGAGWLLAGGAACALALLGVRLRLVGLADLDLSDSVWGEFLLLRSVGRVLVFLCLGLAAWASLLGLLWRKPFGKPWAPPGLVIAACLIFFAIALLDGMGHARRFLPRGDTDGLWRFLYASELDSAIASRSKGEPLPTMFEPGKELSNRPMMRGIRSLHGYHPVVLSQYEDIVFALGGLGSPLLWDHFGLNYLVLPEGAKVPLGWRVIYRGAGRIALEREAKISFARFPGTIVSVSRDWRSVSREALQQMLKEQALDPARQSVCDEGYSWKGFPKRSMGEGGAMIVIVMLPAPGRMQIRASAVRPDESDAPGLAEGIDYAPCLLPVPAAPGWRVRMLQAGADGRYEHSRALSRQMQREWPKTANGFFLLVPVGTDPRIMTELHYAPVSAVWGISLSLIALAACILGGMIGLVLRWMRNAHRRI